jgi:V/A-type H+-transporting ATPase subunit I
VAISQLSLVTIIVAKAELEDLIGNLYEFQEFHPNDEPPFYEDFFLTQLKSRSLDMHIQLSSIIEKLQEEKKYDFKPFVENPDKVQVNATDLTDLTNRATNVVIRIRSKLSCKIKLTSNDLSNLVMLKEATLIVSNVLTRIKLVHELKYFVTIQGYISSKSEVRFKEQFHRWYCHTTPIKKERRGRRKEQPELNSSPPPPSIPTLLENPRFMKMFENVTIAQGIPKYNEIDPTPIIAFVFPFFYGIMFADLGQGLVLTGFGSLLSLQKKMKRRYRYWGKMIISFGISAGIFGLLTGTFFGLELNSFGINCCPLPIPNLRIFETVNGVAEINIDAVMTIVMIVIIIGTFHLSIAYIIAMLDKIRNKEYVEAFTFHLATLVMYSFGILFALSFIGADLQINQLFTSTNPLPVISTLFGTYIPSSEAAIISVPFIITSFFTIIFGRALFSLLNLSDDSDRTKFRLMLGQGVTDIAFIPIVFLTNTISYARLGIFLIIHSALMGFVNGAWSYGILGLPMIILGNIAVMVMEGFLVYIQDLRLHLYEWLTKFTDDVGDSRLFTPIKSDSELVEIRFTLNECNGCHANYDVNKQPMLEVLSP